jgi:two-component system phosphate regulon response regulator OmpR
MPETKKTPILIVDDDTRLRELLQQFLEGEGFDVSAAEDAKHARKVLEDQSFDMLVVDVMMPGEDGLTFVKSLRESSDVPVLMLTALGEVENRIEGLQNGADDYLVKPFEPKELLLRIENILRRAGKTKPKGPVRFGGYVFNRANGSLYKGSEFIHLTSTELKLLTVFAEHLNSPVSREDLSTMLNGISERSIDVSVVRLRKKIEKDPKNPDYLQTDWGAGYVLRDKKNHE